MATLTDEEIMDLRNRMTDDAAAVALVRDCGDSDVIAYVAYREEGASAIDTPRGLYRRFLLDLLADRGAD